MARRKNDFPFSTEPQITHIEEECVEKELAIKKVPEGLVIPDEKLAAIAHQIWARWCQFFLDSCNTDSSGRLIVPTNKQQLWKTQIETPYERLSEADKNKDRKVAGEIMAVIS